MSYDTETVAGRIVVRRTGGHRDAWRKYRIELDGKPAGDLGPGEELVIPATPGPHIIQGRIDWTGSLRLQVLVSAEHSPNVLIHAHGSLAKDLAQLRIVGRTRYLVLEQV